MWSQQWSEQFAIVHESTRNDLLGQLVGTVFYQVGHDMAKKLAAAQYDEKKVQTEVSREDHLKQFEDYWKGAEASWLAQLTDSEKTAFDKLTTPNERDAFRIIRSFHRKARLDSRPDSRSCGTILGPGWAPPVTERDGYGTSWSPTT